MDGFKTFNTAAFPAYTLAELERIVDGNGGTDAMVAEIERRRAVAAGDMTRATPGERLRAARAAGL